MAPGFHAYVVRHAYPPSKVIQLQADVQRASATLAETERHLKHGATRKGAGRLQSSAVGQVLNQCENSISSHDNHGSRSIRKDGDGAARRAESEALYTLEMLRGQHQVLVDNAERAKRTNEDFLDGGSLLKAACWQLCEDVVPDAKMVRNDVETVERAALDIAALAVAVDLTLSCGLTRQLGDAFSCQVKMQTAQYSRFLSYRSP